MVKRPLLPGSVQTDLVPFESIILKFIGQVSEMANFERKYQRRRM